MQTRPGNGPALPQPLVVLAIAVLVIVSLFSAIVYPVIGSIHQLHEPDTGEMNIRQISYGLIQYMEDNDEQFPRAGFDCLDHASDPTLFKRGQRNQCGGNDWQNAIAPYLKSKRVYLSPHDHSSVGEGPWGGGTGTNLNTTDGNFSVLYNDALSHKIPTKAGGYADPAHEDKRANGLKLSEIKNPTQCLLLAEGHGGWDKCSTKSPPLLVATDWTGSTDLQNKWHHDYTITNNYTGIMSASDYAGVVTIQHGLPFNNIPREDPNGHGDGGYVAYVDGHVAYKLFSNPDGSPALCKSLPWTSAIDPKQRNAKIDSCADPNNPVAAGWGGSNWF